MMVIAGVSTAIGAKACRCGPKMAHRPIVLLPDPMRPQARELVDSVTTKLGGEVMARAAVEPLVPHQRADRPNGHPNGRHADEPFGDLGREFN